jgi:hypothetical protein
VKLYPVSSNGAEFLSSFDFSKIWDGTHHPKILLLTFGFHSR